MADGSDVRSEDQFTCSICLDVFTDPVSTPCGHNFCKTCIAQHWDAAAPYNCPLCKVMFSSRPKLKVNTLLRDCVAQFRREMEQKSSSSSSEQQAAKPGEVHCDLCTGAKVKAFKSCLVCLTSYCQTHLEPHLTVALQKKHQLTEPVKNLEDRMCQRHDKLLELFCKSDQTCVCALCAALEHSGHTFVPLSEEFEGKKAELRKTRAGLFHMIQERQQKIKELKASVQTSADAADRERAEGVQVFMALIESAQRGLEQFLKELEDKHKSAEKQAQVFIQELEEEICELMKRSSELEQLSRSEDHLHLIQRFPSLRETPLNKDWTQVSVRPPSYEGTVLRTVAQLELTLREKMKLLREAELKKVQHFTVDLTLDPDTAHPHLIPSDDGKRVTYGDVGKILPNNPERFSKCKSFFIQLCGCFVSFSSGRFYFEVQVKGKTKWDVGVAKGSINRKGNDALSPQNGFWAVWLRNGNEYRALAGPPVLLSLESAPEKVGVFVDYDQGLVSFYDVTAAALIYSFSDCSFPDTLFPFFSPCLNDDGRNSAPLVICAVSPNTCAKP